MVALEFLDFLSKFQVSTYVGIEDFSDKFHFHFTVIVLLISTLIVTVKQYVLKPISCYMPTDIGGKNLLNYLENYCWIQGTIPITYAGNIPTTDQELELLEKDKILYYQWIPFALGLQCIMFYIPRLFWQIFCYNHAGTDIQHLVTSGNQAVHSSEEARNKMVVYLAKSIAQICYQHREYRKGTMANFRSKLFRLCNLSIASKRMGTRITVYYLILKCLYLLNGFVQLYLMQRFLGITGQEHNVFFGLGAVNSIFNGKDWQDSLVFPRVGYCFVRINHLGAMNTIVAQCVLPVNMLIERLYIFLWCWTFVGIILTSISLCIWIWRIIGSMRSPIFTKRFLILKEIITNDEKYDDSLKDFERAFLRQDGLFLLKMISINVGDVIVGDVIVHLWQIFNSNQCALKYADNKALKESSNNRNAKNVFDRILEFHRNLIKGDSGC